MFAAIMCRLGPNFAPSQAACQAQLAALLHLVQLLDPPLHAAISAAACADMLFCFRWVLVALKRELLLDDVPSLWEALWTNPHTPHLLLFAALALLEHRRHALLSNAHPPPCGDCLPLQRARLSRLGALDLSCLQCATVARTRGALCSPN